MRFRFLVLSAIAALVPLAAQAAAIQVIIDGQTVVLSDVQDSAWFGASVRQAAELGIVSGYRNAQGHPTGRFGPSNNITLAEALKIAVEGAGYDKNAYSTVVDSGVTHWSSAYVAVAKSEQFQALNTGRLDRPATRAEVAAIFSSAFRVDVANIVIGADYTDVTPSMTYAAPIEALTHDQVLTGDTDANGQPTHTFRPNDTINRAEVAKMVIAARAKYGTPGKGRSPEGSSSSMAQADLVVHTNAGFSPAVLHIKNGDTVTFRNDGTEQVWVASNPHPTHTDYPGFDELKGMTSGQTYTFTFMRTGTFGYHNHLNPTEQGTIIVGE